MKVLITGAKSAKAFAIAATFTHDQVLLADYDEVPKIPFKNYHFISMGSLNPDTVAHSLLTFCLDHAVNLVVPIYDFEIEALGKSSTLFEEFNIQINFPNAF